MIYSSAVFDNGPDQYEGPLLAAATAQGLTLSTAVSIGLTLYLVVMVAAYLSGGSRRTDDPTGDLILSILATISIGCLGVSIYGLWLFHLGSLEAGLPTLQDNHPDSWLVVRTGLVCSSVAVALTAVLRFLRLGVTGRAVLGHGAPVIALVVAAGISGALPHEHRDAAALIVGALLVCGLANMRSVRRAMVGSEQRLAA